MNNNEDLKNLNDKKVLLINAIAKIIKTLVTDTGKSGRKLSAEYDIGLGLISKITRGKSDIKFTTLWKILNALQIEPEVFIKLLKQELPKDFNFFE